MARITISAASKSTAGQRPLAPGARQLAPMHVSIRVPWHDSSWRGTTCADPGRNRACLILPRIAAEKIESETPGVRWDAPGVKLPPCAAERANFMAPFDFIR